MKYILRLLMLMLTFGFTNLQSLWSQPGYEIQINLKKNNDSIFYLANYYADKFFISDTSTGKPGSVRFTGENQLKQGIYILANQKKEKVIEFLVGEEQFFTISFGEDLNPEKAVINGSIDNQLFFEHIGKVNKVYSQVQQIQTELAKLENEPDKKDALTAKIDSLNKNIADFRLSIIEEKPNILFTKILLAMQEPEIPSMLNDDKEAAFKYYKSNFWKTFDLSDERLLMTPLLPRKLESYFTQLVLPIADSIIKETDYLISLTKENQTMSDFLIWHFVTEYQTPKIMGLDKVFVHIADNYFSIGKLSNVTPSVLENVMERANKMRNSLIGNLAPDLMLIDTTGKFRSFRELNSDFIVLVFWDQTCSHCKNEMAIIDELFSSKKYDLDVYAINSTNDFDAWKKYVKDKNYQWVHVNGTKSITQDFHNLYDIYSVPVIYVLDKTKTIIGKRISAAQIEGILQNRAN
jgi:thiol-disulfide isomerase/thioredoxin